MEQADNSSTAWPAQMPGREMDPIIRVTGYLYEGMSVREYTPERDKAIFQRRWWRRWWLSALSLQPETYLFAYQVNGVEHQVHLLSPLDMIAVQAPDGLWVRRERDELSDGLAPYSAAFCQEWLHRYDLPSWFFGPGHLAMLLDSSEARLFDAHIPDSFNIPPHDSLDKLFPTEPQVPSTDNLFVDPAPQIHVIGAMSDVKRSVLARRFLAVTADIPYVAYVLTDGYVVPRSRSSHADKQYGLGVPRLQAWDFCWYPEDENNIIASYKLVTQGIVKERLLEQDAIEDDLGHEASDNEQAFEDDQFEEESFGKAPFEDRPYVEKRSREEQFATDATEGNTTENAPEEPFAEVRLVPKQQLDVSQHPGGETARDDSAKPGDRYDVLVDPGVDPKMIDTTNGGENDGAHSARSHCRGSSERTSL